MRLLDLYCGEGLAAWGYWLSGAFSEIVGIDIDDHRDAYAFDFVQRNALSLDYAFLSQFDFVHASPPCQAYSRITPRPQDHPRLIVPTLHMLHASDLPHVVENVEGSGRELRPNLRLYGTDVGLPMGRPRLFRISDEMSSLSVKTENRCSENGNPVSEIRPRIAPHGRITPPRSVLEEAFGLALIPSIRRRRLTNRGILQGIPPAMTLHIVRSLGYPVLKIGGSYS